MKWRLSFAPLLVCTVALALEGLQRDRFPKNLRRGVRVVVALSQWSGEGRPSPRGFVFAADVQMTSIPAVPEDLSLRARAIETPRHRSRLFVLIAEGLRSRRRVIRALLQLFYSCSLTASHSLSAL